MPADSTKVYDIVEQVPVWGSCGALTWKRGGNVHLRATCQTRGCRNQIPQEGAKKGLAGKVFVEFVVDTDGSVIDVAILRGVHPLLDEEAIRVVNSFPEFIPGQQRGKPVKVRYRLP